jgi:hypothetical protein
LAFLPFFSPDRRRQRTRLILRFASTVDHANVAPLVCGKSLLATAK